ncbi:MAG: TolC family outer membrane protein [Burkholderiales bacterium]
MPRLLIPCIFFAGLQGMVGYAPSLAQSSSLAQSLGAVELPPLPPIETAQLNNRAEPRTTQPSVVLVQAASAAPVTLLDVIRLAKDSDPKFRGALADSRASEFVLDQARAGFLPTIRADFENTDSRQQILSSSNPIFGSGFSTFGTDNHTISITQPIFRLDLIERLEQARAIVRQAQYTRLAAEQDLLQRSATAYLAVLAAQDSLDLGRSEKDSLRRQLDLAEGRLKGGLGTVTNLYDVSARYTVAQAREIEAENKLADAKQALREITNANAEKLQRLRDTPQLVLPDPVDVGQWVAKAIDQNLPLRAKSEGVNVALQEVQRQRAGHVPTLNLVANRNDRKAGSTLFGGGSHVLTTEMTLRLSIPVFEGGLTSAVTAEAAQRYQKSMEERELEMRSVERQARAAFQAVVSGVSLVQALQQSVRSQQSAFEARELGARTGVYTQLQVLDAQRELFLVRRDYAQARYDYLLNTLKLKQVAGMLSEQDLGAIHAALE